CPILLEIGPQPHLKALALRSDAALDSRVYPSLRRRHKEWEDILETLGKLYVQGQAIDWRGFDRGQHRKRIALPTYPFDRQRYWHAARDENSSQLIWQRAVNAALVQSTQVPIGVDVGAFSAKWQALNRWAVAEIARTLRSVDAFAVPGSRFDAQSVVAACGILPANIKLVNRWLHMLADAGYLLAHGSQFENPTVFPEIDLSEAWGDVARTSKDDSYLLEYLHNCSQHLRGVLMGTTSPLETLFPGGSPDLARNVYENSSGARYANRIVASAVQMASIAAPARRGLRILEVGAGTGATTDAVLRVVSPTRTLYHFTDVSETFLYHAKARFSPYPFVQYSLLDIENEEHIARHRQSFDVVIAANVIHATRDIQASLSGVARLLAPGGMLILLEVNQAHAWHEITTGLLQGWHKSEDFLQEPRTLLGVDEWNSALNKAGFVDVASAPEPGSPAEVIGLHVILARNSAVDADGVSAISAAADSAWSADYTSPSAAVDAESAIFAQRLQEAPAAEQQDLLMELVSQQIAKILQLDSNAMPRKRDRLVDLGMDSLMAVELRNRLSTLLRVNDLPVTLIFDYPTPDAIAGYLLDRLQGKQHEQPEASPAQPAEQQKRMSAKEVTELSDEEVAELLRERLAR
ncbi:MAG: methyltransferase, partial [Acidobacteriota bacterium]